MHVVAWFQNQRGGPDYGSVRFVARAEVADAAAGIEWVRVLAAAQDHMRPEGYLWAIDSWDTMPALADWQERVIAEKADLDAKLPALQKFIENGFSGGMGMQEKLLLISQRLVMKQYSGVLSERIAFYLAKRRAEATTPTESVSDHA